MHRLTKIGTFATRAAITASLFSIMALASPASAGEPIYRIDINKTQIVRLPAQAGSIVIGNADIADVTIHSPTTIFVVGRGFGETNLVIMDRDGQTMMDANVQVTSVTPTNGVRLFNAKSRETYTCSPYCQPSPVLGDEAGFIGANSETQSAPVSGAFVFDQGPATSSSLSPTEIAGGPQALSGSQPANNIPY
ncbi:hypothetical protein GCM10007853_28150 [Algimonas ampicilliniresistens]|uniref:Pilus formation protein N-terminal domain-containing protein n=1 Tax=Algimonas ampicilliniresistens TaxID=1298735 RepID=A0ABQ5VBM5_9PROT|nr:pilus assembly protein N-terminal domain-containing protein [Algimonas ampicilliniresistens]GLQ24941.1 hypothetical protein GCM10007853_28150 [Algimonas ampicilliniresistens]